MKKDIHPKYYDQVTVICSCGKKFITGSTVSEIKTELCSACHPFYTGKQKLIDTARRVEKFAAKVKAREEVGAGRKGKKIKRAARAVVKAGKEVIARERKVVSKKKAVKSKDKK